MVYMNIMGHGRRGLYQDLLHNLQRDAAVQGMTGVGCSRSRTTGAVQGQRLVALVQWGWPSRLVD